MKLNFRQGLISYQQSGAQAVFLLAGTVPNNVTLSVAPQPTIATIAHGSSDYLLKFDQTVLNAWQLTTGVDQWLTIDLNVISGALTYGITTLEPITNAVTPMNPVAGQLWFDLNTTVMKTFNGVKWIDTPKLVVAKVSNGNTNQIQSYSTGSSVGLSVPGSPGFLMLDSQLRPLRTSTGELLTSDSPVRIKTTVGTSGVLSEPVTGFTPVRANEAIPAMSLVYFSGEDAVSLASSDPALVDPKTPIGIVLNALATNEVGTVSQQGEVVYDGWNWDASQIGKPLYCGFNGQLTTTRPQSVQVYRVGYIKNAKTILFYIDSETKPQVLSTPGSIISGTPPITAVTALNGYNEIVSTISMAAASPTVDGYMTAAQAASLSSFDTRITTNASDITALETSKANTTHSHVIADVTDLQTDLDDLTTAVASKMSKIAGGVVGNFPSIDAGGALIDSTYAYTAFSLTTHVHTIAEVTNLQTDLDGKAAVVHSHVIADITDLQPALDDKAFVVHTHVIADVSGLDVALDGKAPLVHVHTIADVTGLADDLTIVDARITSNSDDITSIQTVLTTKAEPLKVRDSQENSPDYTEFVATESVVFEGFRIAESVHATGRVVVAQQPLEFINGATSDIVSTYPNLNNVSVEQQIIFGEGLVVTTTGTYNETVIVAAAAQSPSFPGGGVDQVMGNDGSGGLIPLVMSVQTNDALGATLVNIGENTHGNVILYTASGDGVSGTGSNFTITGGNGPSQGGHGGNLILTGGAGALDGTVGQYGGAVLITSGNAGANASDDSGAGSIKITLGQSNLAVPDSNSPFIALQTYSGGGPGSVRSLVLNMYGAMGWAGADVTDQGQATYGTAGQVLQSTGPQSQPLWGDAPAVPLSAASDIVFSAGLAANDVLTFDGTNWINQPLPAPDTSTFVQKIGDTMTGQLTVPSVQTSHIYGPLDGGGVPLTIEVTGASTADVNSTGGNINLQGGSNTGAGLAGSVLLVGGASTGAGAGANGGGVVLITGTGTHSSGNIELLTADSSASSSGGIILATGSSPGGAGITPGSIDIKTNGVSRLLILGSGAFVLSGDYTDSTGKVLTSAGFGSAPTWQTPASGGGGGSSLLTINNQTVASYPLTLSDAAAPTVVRMTYPTACAVVVPQPSTTNIPVGSSVLVGWQGDGQVTFTTEGGSSTVLNYKNKAVTSTATPSGASAEFTGACPQQFAESWDNGLTGYSQSPYGLFTIASQTPYGNVLQFAGGASGNQNGIYGKSFTSISVNRIEFKFRLLSVTGTSANGTPNISFLNGSTGPIIAPKANTLYDSLGRIQVNLGGGVVYLGSGPPALNVWYRVRISYLAGAGNSFVDVTDLSNGGTFGSVQWAGDGAAGITVNTLNFTNPGSTSNDAGVQFDDIFMYNCASTITTTTGVATAKIDQKFGKVRLIKVAADEWDLDGDLATS